MSRRQRESFLLGITSGAIVAFLAVLVISLSPLIRSDDATTAAGAAPGSAAAGTTDTTAATNGQGRGQGMGMGQGMGQGMGMENADPLSFGAADPRVVDIFTNAGCVTCHSIKGVGGAGAAVGPHLYMTGALAATRRPGDSAEAYIRESILNPDAFIVPNCPTGACPSGVMPKTFGEMLSPEELDTIVAYLSALGTPDEANVLNQP